MCHLKESRVIQTRRKHPRMMRRTLAAQAKLRAEHGESTQVFLLPCAQLPGPRERDAHNHNRSWVFRSSKDRELEGRHRFGEKQRAPAGSSNPWGQRKAMQHFSKAFICFSPLLGMAVTFPTSPAPALPLPPAPARED